MKSTELIIDLLQQIYGALSFIAGLLVGVWIRKPSKSSKDRS